MSAINNTFLACGGATTGTLPFVDVCRCVPRCVLPLFLRFTFWNDAHAGDHLQHRSTALSLSFAGVSDSAITLTQNFASGNLGLLSGGAVSIDASGTVVNSTLLIEGNVFSNNIASVGGVYVLPCPALPC